MQHGSKRVKEREYEDMAWNHHDSDWGSLMASCDPLGFMKMGISWLALWLLASQGGISSKE